MSQTREQKLKELETLSNMLVVNLRSNTVDTINDIIDEVLEELYPVTDESPIKSECPFKDEEMTYDEFMSAIAEAAEVETEYITFEEGKYRIFKFGGGRLARKGWDNGLNHEYIENVPLVGLVKVYQSSSVSTEPGKEGKSYFKNVIHSFEPTKADSESNDWYFL